MGEQFEWGKLTFLSSGSWECQAEEQGGKQGELWKGD